jgi:hypothetical protein
LHRPNGLAFWGLIFQAFSWSSLKRFSVERLFELHTNIPLRHVYSTSFIVLIL